MLCWWEKYWELWGCLKWAPFPSDCTNVLFHKCFQQNSPILKYWMMSCLLNGPNSSDVSCQAIDNFEIHPTYQLKAGVLLHAKEHGHEGAAVLLCIWGILSTCCPSVQFELAQGGRIEVAPQNPSKMWLYSRQTLKKTWKGEELMHCWVVERHPLFFFFCVCQFEWEGETFIPGDG